MSIGRALLSALHSLLRPLAVLFGGFGVIALVAGAAAKTPNFDHVVLVVMENHSFDQIKNDESASYLHQLARGGVLFVNSFGVSHPSQPNYLTLFSGSTHSIKDDGDHEVAGPNLVTVLAKAKKTFTGFVEWRSPRKHNPWESFADAKDSEQPMASFPSDFSKLSSVNFVIPNLSNDMHDGSIGEGDTWLKTNLAAYADWAKSHKSLLIVTFDEDDSKSGNQIYTVFVGARVKTRHSVQKINHYNVLRTIESIEGVPAFGERTARAAAPLGGVWMKP